MTRTSEPDRPGSRGDPLGPLARHDGEPAFAEPWQAEALAMAALLTERGVFTRAAWADALGSALREDPDDTLDAYYGAVLRALERLLAEQGAVSEQLLGARIEAWRRAYLRTPHGQPVELETTAGSEPVT